MAGNQCNRFCAVPTSAESVTDVTVVTDFLYSPLRVRARHGEIQNFGYIGYIGYKAGGQ